MAIEGSLADVGLADICQLLSLGRKTGCLTVTDRSNFGYVYFENGRVVHASVLNRPDRLGELLVRNGAIGREDLARAVKEQGRKEGKRLGEILVEQGALLREELERWTAVQVEEAVYHLFNWSQGSFHFDPDQRPDPGEGPLASLSTDALLMEGARRVDEWSLIERKIPSLDLVFKLVRDPQEEKSLDLSGNQRKLLPLLDGRRTVQELSRESGLVEFETGKALYELIQAGFLQQVGQKAPGAEEKDDSQIQRHLNLGQAFYRAGMLEDAAREFLEALKGDPLEPTARFRLGLIRLKERDPKGALEHFGSMPEKEAGSYGVLRNRALALERLGRFEDALTVLRKARARRAGDPGLLLAQGIVELKSGAAAAARTTLQKYRADVGKNPLPPIYYAYAVLAAAQAGHLEESVTLGREGLHRYPAEASILVNTGAVLDRKGDHEAAEQYFLRALFAGSEVPPQAHRNLGDQALRRGDEKAARAQYEHAVKLDAALGDEVFARLGTLVLRGGDRTAAAEHFRRALELNPKNAVARKHLEDLTEPR